MSQANGSYLQTGDNAFYSASASNDEVVSSPYAEADPETSSEAEMMMKNELAKTEEEILTLRQVLAAKTQQANDLKKKLGVTVWSEMKTDIKVGFQTIRESDTVQKTNEKFRQLNVKVKSSTAYQKTSEVVQTAKEKTSTGISSAGTKVSEKLSTLRNSTTFKSFEEKVGSAYSSVKDRLTSSRSEQNFEEALKEELEKREHATKDEQSVDTVENV